MIHAKLVASDGSMERFLLRNLSFDRVLPSKSDPLPSNLLTQKYGSLLLSYPKLFPPKIHHLDRILPKKSSIFQPTSAKFYWKIPSLELTALSKMVLRVQLLSSQGFLPIFRGRFVSFRQDKAHLRLVAAASAAWQTTCPLPRTGFQGSVKYSMDYMGRVCVYIIL